LIFLLREKFSGDSRARKYPLLLLCSAEFGHLCPVKELFRVFYAFLLQTPHDLAIQVVESDTVSMRTDMAISEVAIRT
jgi:hypothetical protein